MNRTQLQTRHSRQSAISDTFASATLAAATRSTRTEAQRRQHTRDARKVARLQARGELSLTNAQIDARLMSTEETTTVLDSLEAALGGAR